ncbi:MAG: PD-(D/E)XK nuclease family protein [Devosia sp.]|uniref:PD-(D/E)XK nuclease family protein n=1 Tax=Devosia sp. TaxID=1871048 RepID=UPI001A5809F7|nr:PD-(D/E)XK nuclease family protein [Devosia sp.]MBL8600121.1 PD-(D/E)XK nuclease family protein [Devosia sp.]
MSRRGLYTIAPHGRFLDLLADRVLDGRLLGGWERSGPFWLSDVTIILPTRRSRLVLAELFATRLGGVALLPDIRTFGGESAEEEPFLPPVESEALPPEASILERRLTLSRLVRQFALSADGFASPPNAAEVLTLADSFGQLIDDLTIEDGDLTKLNPLMEGSLAENWQDVLRFLEPALDAWPKILAERGQIDGAERRNRQLRKQAATAPLLYGERPVIAAGSTGSIAATAELLRAIANLPRGAVVLPGLDTALTPKQHEMLIEGANTQGHPQYGLAKLLRALGAGIADVEELAGPSPRTDIMRHALAPTEETARWSSARAAISDDLDDALRDVSIIAAPNLDLEARAIALAARQAVADGRSVGIVSRDQTLARRVRAELARHGITVDDPAGAPLFQSSAGRLARQALAVAVNKYAPIDTVALLRNGAVTIGLDRFEVLKQSNRLDLKLRGQRPRQGIDGLIALAKEEDQALPAVLNALGRALEPLCLLLEQSQIEAPSLARALDAAVTGLIGGAELPGIVEFRLWARALAEVSDGGAPFPPVILDSVLAALMAGEKVQPDERQRDDIHIWGELEARLQNPDLMILAGINEDIWPPAADPGPWLSRGMRMAIGLEPPERQQGQAAHDFEMALGNAEVVIAFATRIGTSPALASRLVQRLDAFVGDAHAKALRARGAHWLAQAAGIDSAGRPQPARRPMPRPPAKDRPRELSITEVEPLMRSPYDIYARRVLRLQRLDPLGTQPDAKERGSMIHKVFERFVAEGLSFRGDDALPSLERMAREEFAGLDAIQERREIWLRRFRRAAEMFLDYERGRTGLVSSRTAEIKGRWIFPSTFELVGKADRVDQLSDGTLEIIDFKTGGIPGSADMKDFDAPQLLLEAAMAREGVFPGIAKRDSSALTYIKIGLGPATFQVTPFRLRKGMTLMQAVDEIVRRLQGHVDAFLLNDRLPMTSRIRPRVITGRKSFPGDYDHLARTDEWTLTAGVDDP